MADLSDEYVDLVIRSVQPHLDTACKAWRELAEDCRYWLEADRALNAPAQAAPAGWKLVAIEPTPEP